jgi:hypothetical protein
MIPMAVQQLQRTAFIRHSNKSGSILGCWSSIKTLVTIQLLDPAQELKKNFQASGPMLTATCFIFTLKGIKMSFGVSMHSLIV